MESSFQVCPQISVRPHSTICIRHTTLYLFGDTVVWNRFKIDKDCVIVLQ